MHCDIANDERVDQLAKEDIDQYTDPVASVHDADMKSLVSCYIQQEV